MHRLISKDVNAMTGECQECGSVALRFRSNPNHPGTKMVMCETARKIDRRNSSKLTKKSHGLNSYEAARFVEGKVCGICGSGDNLVVDHCHVQKKIRDALCGTCNKGLGLFKEDPSLLLAAVEYLRCHGTPG